jgi:predicted AAA+ superfamily ATPase
MIGRVVNLPDLLLKKSFFFFGQRGVGKSFLIRHQLPGAKVYDLLHAPTLDRLARRSTLIGEELTEDDKLVVIDEIQRIPRLLDEVHRLIESRGTRFLLTGSSARKLRRGGANLLAGRAWEARLFPLVSDELGDFDLMRHLLVGGLPSVWQSDDPWEELKAYTGTYLREEIIAEAVVRKLDSFVSFLDVAATKVGEEVNYESMASDCRVSARTIESFFTLLEDTLIGFRLKPYRRTVRRKATARAKFYLADLGIASSLLGRRELVPGTSPFGVAFEHFIILELRAYLAYRRRDEELSFWRSRANHEVVALIGKQLAIEVKAAELTQDKHLKSLRALREEGQIERFAVVSRDPHPRCVDGINIYPWKTFLRLLWADKLLT